MSETDFLKLKKHDNVETNTEKFDIENYLNGNWDKINENAKEVNTNISNINSKNTELEKELKEAQEDFYQNSIRGQASGEYIHVEDSSNCRAKIGIGGNQEQETREGYNLLSASKQYTYNSGNVKLTSDGIGKYTMSGDGTAQTETIKYAFELEKEYTIKSNDYLHIMNKGTTTSNAIIVFLDSNMSGIVSYDFATNNKIENLSNYAGKTIKYIQLYMNPVKVDITLTPMIINAVSTAKNFEQYGAMPSPDYPSEIVTVGSNVNIAKWIQGQVGTDGVYTYREDAICTDYIQTTNGMTYSIQKNVMFQNSQNMMARLFDKDKNILGSIIALSNDALSNAFTLNNPNVKYIRFVQFQIGITPDNNYEIKIEKGTVATPYSKFGQGCVKVTKCNKNILKNTAVSGKLNGVNRTVKEDGSVIINGTSTAWANLTVGTIQGDGNSCILSGSPSNSEIFLTVNNTKEGDIAQSKNGSDAIFLPLKGSTYSVIVCIPSKKTFNNEVVKPLIRTVNDEDNTYIKHQEQTYIMPVQQEMLEGDTFDWDNEEEVHIWNKLILDGTESIEKFQYSDHTFLIAKGAKNVNASEILVKSNMFMGVSYNNRTISRNYIIYVEIETGNIIFRNTSYSALADFKTWLKSQYDAGTPVTIYYKIATPTKLPFTDEQKAVAKELNNARTYKNVTNITTDSIAILDLDYAKDLETLLNNTQALAVNNASEGV